MPQGQVVDTPTATEFMQEARKAISSQDLRSLGARLSEKAQGFHRILAEGRAADASPDELRQIVRSIFSTRRKVDAIFEAVPPPELAAAFDRLLHSTEPLPDRIHGVDELFADLPEVAFDLPGEILHFTYPDRHWLWSRWIWDPRIETGALSLVTMEEFDLSGSTRGETYFKVGEAMAFVNETGKAVGFTDMAEGLFGMDVFLACVYGIYMYTVLRMRMTQEFNQVVPQLPELVARLLGVHRMEV